MSSVPRLGKRENSVQKVTQPTLVAPDPLPSGSYRRLTGGGFEPADAPPLFPDPTAPPSGASIVSGAKFPPFLLFPLSLLAPPPATDQLILWFTVKGNERYKTGVRGVRGGWVLLCIWVRLQTLFLKGTLKSKEIISRCRHYNPDASKEIALHCTAKFAAPGGSRIKMEILHKIRVWGKKNHRI